MIATRPRRAAGGLDARATALAARLAAYGGLAFASAALVYLVSSHTPLGQQVENPLFEARQHWSATGRREAVALLDAITNWASVLIAGTTVVVAQARGRPRLGLGAVAVVAVSTALTEALKWQVLWRPPLDPGASPAHVDNVFPSGHATFAMALVTGLVLVVPDRWRGPVALAGGCYVGTVSAAIVEGGWHRASEVIGAHFVVLGVALWVCAGLVVWSGAARVPPREPMWGYLPLAVVAVSAAVVNVVGVHRTVLVIGHAGPDSRGVGLAHAASLAAVALAVAVALGTLLVALSGRSLDPSARERPGPAAPRGVRAPPAPRGRPGLAAPRGPGGPAGPGSAIGTPGPQDPA